MINFTNNFLFLCQKTLLTILASGVFHIGYSSQDDSLIEDCPYLVSEFRDRTPIEISTYQTLNKSHSQLIGKIPKSLSLLNHLTCIDLSFNQLSGPLPDSLSHLSHLVSLNLMNNRFSGPLPNSLGHLSELQHLYLSNNQLSGSFPDSLSYLSNLKDLGLSFNQFSGLFPDSLAHLSRLKNIYLNNNQLSGPLPNNLDHLFQLERLDLSNNQLSGSLPDSIGSASRLFDLQVSNNQLSGPLPDTLGRLSRVAFLNLSNNQFSGFLPNSFKNLHSLGSLSLHNNLWNPNYLSFSLLCSLSCPDTYYDSPLYLDGHMIQASKLPYDQVNHLVIISPNLNLLKSISWNEPKGSIELSCTDNPFPFDFFSWFETQELPPLRSFGQVSHFFTYRKYEYFFSFKINTDQNLEYIGLSTRYKLTQEQNDLISSYMSTFLSQGRFAQTKNARKIYEQL